MRYYWYSAFTFLIVTLLLVAFAESLEQSSWDDMKVKHTWNSLPVNWESLGHPHAGSTIRLYIALKSERESALTEALSEVSNPRHPRYGAHLSRDQVAKLVEPHPDTLELISAWLVHHGIRPSSILTTHGGAWLTVTDVLVSQGNQLLGASYQLYRNSKTNETILRTVSYALPTVLHTHIRTVAPTTYFTSTRVARQTPRRRSFGPATTQTVSGKLVKALSSRADLIEPEFLRWLYTTNPYESAEYVPSAADRNRLGIVGFNGEFPSRDDLEQFMTLFSERARGATYDVVAVNGGVDRLVGLSGLLGDANSNMQYASAMAFPTPIVFYSIGGLSRWEPETGREIAGDRYLEWFNYMLEREPNIPQTISISYSEVERALPLEYREAMCDLFARLGSLGVSVLVASGNAGVGGVDCDDGEGNIRFIPEFPSSCPWVTSVGGTKDFPEVAADLSGGGFSENFERPEYQVNAVGGFLIEFQMNPDSNFNYFNPSNRGYPDIAAEAEDILYVFDNNGDNIGDGTSFAVSTVAGIVSLLNDFRVSHRPGNPPLGFLNYLLYGEGSEGLNDITDGSNPGCGTDGFPAMHGWDPVTGLGTLNFEKLLKFVAQLPPEGPPRVPPEPPQVNPQ